MRLLVIRHAIAEDRDVFAETGQDDSKRPLTHEGRKKMKRGGRGLRRLVPGIDTLASSPLVRALQTAEIVADVYGLGPPTLVPALASGQDPETALAWLRKMPDNATVAIVGHEPHLGQLVTLLLCGGERVVLEIKKGAACLLDVPSGARAASATLLFSLTPGQLRQLGG
jgi:phosphohistidine phosphatase